ncbi:rhodanese-like domain-containing protein [Aurantimonas sp. Leaf443]|uniref:rhodanese-like domain-containing protein n=1 Tax=Aurantimonas sp. Leaf443 TaxID=1736378 RepID=UPI0006F689E0|nr:rhodanese-like domain-containing protein [Aurantimonas sp. Leaf443]KQT83381.1 hypothetical protein ASG48_12505 [Aurantimonas sp. Leaf443]
MDKTPGFATLDTEEAARAIADGGHVVVDVREPNELAASGKIPGAVNIPLGQLAVALDPADPQHEPRLTDGTPLLFYCAAGGRSAKAADLAVANGVSDVSHIAGGFGAWRRTGGASEPV